jgi:hypothetical protein
MLMFDRSGTKRGAARLALALLPAVVGGFAAMAITGFTAPLALSSTARRRTRATRRTRETRRRAPGCTAITTSLTWSYIKYLDSRGYRRWLHFDHVTS